MIPALILFLAAQATPTSLSIGQVSAIYMPPSDVLSASWVDAPSNGKQWWAVFNISGAKLASGVVNPNSSGNYSVSAQFPAPADNRVLFGVCDTSSCKYGKYFAPATNSSFSYSVEASESVPSSDSAATSSSSPPPVCNGIPENLSTVDAVIVSVQPASGSTAAALSESSSAEDALSTNLAGNGGMLESSSTSDTVSIRFTVQFPAPCSLSFSGNAVTCSIGP